MKQYFNKQFLAIYAVWVFIHTYLYITGYKDYRSFFPFTGDARDYDASEFFVYTFSPLLIIFLAATFSENKPTQK